MSEHRRRPAGAAATVDRPKAANQPAAAQTENERKLGAPSTQSLQISSVAWGVLTGYGRVTMSLFAALQTLGINVALLGRPGIVGSDPIPEPIVEAEGNDFDTVLHIGNPPDWKPVRGKDNIGLAWWPYSAIPPAWIANLYGIRAVFVPSQWCADGMTPVFDEQRIEVLPLGVDGKTFETQRRTRGDLLRFLLFDNRADSYKAAADAAIAAFQRAFPSRDDVALDIWSTQPAPSLYAPDSRINFRRSVGSDEDLVRLYHRYDAMVAPSRGAGFGLVPIEAMATGMPVYHNGQGGYAGITDLGVLIGARKTTTLRSEHPSACCFDPTIDIFADRLAELDRKYDAIQDAAIDAAAIVRQRYSWERMARNLIDLI